MEPAAPEEGAVERRAAAQENPWKGCEAGMNLE